VVAATRVEHGHLATTAVVQFSYLVSAGILVVLFALDHAALERQDKHDAEIAATRLDQ
jgi:hypothetical protein